MSGGDSPDSDDDSPEGLTDDDLRRIREFARTPVEDRDPADLVPDDVPREDESGVSRRSSNGIGATTCREIRERMGDATTAREVVEAYPDRHTSEIMRHAYGECTCPTDYPPKASPQITPEECRRFREHFSDGYPVAEIAETFARSDNSVTRHVFGRCSHPSGADLDDAAERFEFRRKQERDVEEWECKRLREAYNRNDKVDLDAVATGMILREETVAYHLYGLCDCEHGEPPTEDPLDGE